MVELHGAGGAACRRGMAFFIMFSLLLTLTVHVHVRVPPFHCDAEFCDKFDSECYVPLSHLIEGMQDWLIKARIVRKY